MEQRPGHILRRMAHGGLVLAGAAALTLVFFMVLPLMQTIGKKPAETLQITQVDTVMPPPPPPPPEPEPEEEPEEEPEPPELAEDRQLIDLSQLELALNPGVGDGWFQGDFTVDLKTVAGGDRDVDALFSLADLDQRPRVVHQPSPTMNAQVRRKAPGTVTVIFIVDEEGRVQSPQVQKSDDRIFERPALAAIKQWRFEPGKRNGEPVRFRMRVPITFPEG